MITTPNLGLKVWNLTTDPYDSGQLADNWARVDEHDHTSGKGKQILTGAIADGAVTAAKLATGANVPPDSTITTAKLAAGSVTTSKIASEGWTAYTPTITNMSNATSDGSYIKIGRMVFFRAICSFQTSSAVSGAIGFSLPVPAVGSFFNMGPFSARITDYGTGTYLGHVYPQANSVQVYVINASTTYATYTGCSSSIPMTWAVNDTVDINGVYEAAA